VIAFLASLGFLCLIALVMVAIGFVALLLAIAVREAGS